MTVPFLCFYNDCAYIIGLRSIFFRLLNVCWQSSPSTEVHFPQNDYAVHLRQSRRSKRCRCYLQDPTERTSSLLGRYAIMTTSPKLWPSLIAFVGDWRYFEANCQRLLRDPSFIGDGITGITWPIIAVKWGQQVPSSAQFRQSGLFRPSSRHHWTSGTDWSRSLHR